MRNGVDMISLMALELAKLPGVGRKSAQRLAYHIIAMPKEDVKLLVDAIWNGRENARLCSCCGNYTESELCTICRDDEREKGVVCVVKDARDLAAMERIRDYKGVYHVLHGVLSPMDNIGPNDIDIKGLLRRIAENEVSEVILATNPDIEGEATASYIARLLKPMGIKVSRIAHGVPVGSDLEYADEVTLAKALEGRRVL